MYLLYQLVGPDFFQIVCSMNSSIPELSHLAIETSMVGRRSGNLASYWGPL